MDGWSNRRLKSSSWLWNGDLKCVSYCRNDDILLLCKVLCFIFILQFGIIYSFWTDLDKQLKEKVFIWARGWRGILTRAHGLNVTTSASVWARKNPDHAERHCLFLVGLESVSHCAVLHLLFYSIQKVYFVCCTHCTETALLQQQISLRYRRRIRLELASEKREKKV